MFPPYPFLKCESFTLQFCVIRHWSFDKKPINIAFPQGIKVLLCYRPHKIPPIGMFSADIISCPMSVNQYVP